MKYMARSMDAAGISTAYVVTTEDGPLRARELVHAQMLEDRQRPQTILVCITGGKTNV